MMAPPEAGQIYQDSDHTRVKVIAVDVVGNKLAFTRLDQLETVNEYATVTAFFNRFMKPETPKGTDL